MQYLSLWFSSLSIIPSSFIHAFANYRNLFFLWLNFIIYTLYIIHYIYYIYTHIFHYIYITHFLYPSIHWQTPRLFPYLGYYEQWLIPHGSAHTSLRNLTAFPLDIYPEMSPLDHGIFLFLTFFKAPPHCFPQWPHQPTFPSAVHIPTNGAQGFLLLKVTFRHDLGYFLRSRWCEDRWWLNFRHFSHTGGYDIW